jgi:hypothetical protein
MQGEWQVGSPDRTDLSIFSFLIAISQKKKLAALERQGEPVDWRGEPEFPEKFDCCGAYD